MVCVRGSCCDGKVTAFAGDIGSLNTKAAHVWTVKEDSHDR